MAKHPVPKKKMSNARTAKRFHAFAEKKRRFLTSLVNVVICKSCGNPKLNQAACSSCGDFRGRNIRSATETGVKTIKV